MISENFWDTFEDQYRLFFDLLDGQIARIEHPNVELANFEVLEDFIWHEAYHT